MKKLNEKGLTLIEVLIVLAIMGLFAFIAVPHITRTLITAKIKSTEIELPAIQSALELYYLEKNRYPENLSELVRENFLGEEALTDGFGNPYNYKIINTGSGMSPNYMLSSSGRDGIPFTDDDIQPHDSQHRFK